MAKTKTTDFSKPRTGEVIGGSFVVMRRGDDGRVRPSRVPFEYDNAADAEEQAKKLAGLNPGFTFEVFFGLVKLKESAKDQQAA